MEPFRRNSRVNLQMMTDEVKRTALMPDKIDAIEYSFDAPQTSTALAPQALILAAGRGQRLGDHVEEFPKCLLQVGGRSLLDHQLSMLAAAGIHDVCVVAGYHRNVVARACQDRAHVINSPDWATTNSLYSFWLARHWVNRSVVVMNCDVLADPKVLPRLLKNESSSFAFDSSSGDDEEHMKVELSDGTLKSMSKSLDAARVHGENVGMLHFSSSDVRELFSHAKSILDDGGQNMWMAAAVQMLARESTLHGVDISDSAWIEIDYQEDLEAARSNIWPLIERRQHSRNTQFDMLEQAVNAEFNVRS